MAGRYNDIYNIDMSDHRDLDLTILYLYKAFTGKFCFISWKNLTLRYVFFFYTYLRFEIRPSSSIAQPNSQNQLKLKSQEGKYSITCPRSKIAVLTYPFLNSLLALFNLFLAATLSSLIFADGNFFKVYSKNQLKTIMRDIQ